MTDVYTDGACKGNPGPGGWAWVVPDGPWANGAEAASTNQRMELMAVLDALRNLSGPLEVVSDSTYVVHCFRDRWWEGWMKRGWKNAKKEPVANRDLWEPLVELYRPRADEVTFRWVKGHAGDEWNDVADRLAVEAAETQQARSGTGRPEALGPRDDAGFDPPGSEPGAEPSRFQSSAWRPAGRAVAVLGLQPTELGGYDENDVTADVRRRLGEILVAKQSLDPDLVVLTGLRLGAETVGAEAAAAHDVPYAAVLPYPDPDAKWPASSRRRFAELVAGATVVVRLQAKPPETAAQAGQAMDRRNGWLRQVADEAVIVWDGREPRVGAVVSAFERDRPDDVWIVAP